MNTTVWCRQINEGLHSFIQNIVTLTDKKGDAVPVPVRIKKFDEDFKKEDYPMITIYNVSISRRDETRYYPFPVLRNVNVGESKGKLERTAVPYSLIYQIDFYSTLMKDMEEMLQKWEFEVSRDFNLPVIDSGGTQRFAHALQTGSSVFKQDKLSDNSRVFNTAITYRIWAEIDEENADNIEDCDIVTDIQINTNP